MCFCGLCASNASQSHLANCGSTKEQEENWGGKKRLVSSTDELRQPVQTWTIKKDP